jgi:hypothetical protein
LTQINDSELEGIKLNSITMPKSQGLEEIK